MCIWSLPLGVNFVENSAHNGRQTRERGWRANGLETESLNVTTDAELAATAG